MIIEAVACLSAAARGIVPLQAVEYPEGVSGFGPPLVAFWVLGVGEFDIIVIIVLLGLFPGAELEYILLVVSIGLRPADGFLLD